ncbi:hypothetical protein CAPTEDRAFT_213219 [Capitella teleta]|uniref:Uncharacterized protein n=1 Tax=Capitella teleta TaxID=283909 RepID=R7TCF2_CAPTE|nr:hypothetical protein CAPTEDRAFT_213219 [Capitella teleta]|eukprot:ELT89177.1 hypothetical protein CAPTEDRAFT_213219 [Capitella teleta]
MPHARSRRRLVFNQPGIIDASTKCEELAPSGTISPCPLCPMDHWEAKQSARLETHLKVFHMKHSFLSHGHRILACKLDCPKTHGRIHYHCGCGYFNRLPRVAQRNTARCNSMMPKSQQQQQQQHLSSLHLPSQQQQQHLPPLCLPSQQQQQHLPSQHLPSEQQQQQHLPPLCLPSQQQQQHLPSQHLTLAAAAAAPPLSAPFLGAAAAAVPPL